MRKKRRCPDCYVKPGEFHSPGCDCETCAECGLQKLSCGCSTTKRVRWDGEHVMTRAAIEFGLYAKLGNNPFGWEPCHKDDPEAHPDLNSVPCRLRWDKVKLRWVPKGNPQRDKLVCNFAERRAEIAMTDADGGTGVEEEFVLLARQLADRMTDDEIKAFLKENKK